MNNIVTLRKLVSKLNTTEINLLKKQINYSNKSTNDGKTVVLLKLLLENEEYSSNDMQKFIYGKQNYLAFNKLCNRLKDSIYDIFLTENSIKSSNYSKRNTTLFELRKSIIQADIIQLRGVNEEVMQIYNSAITKAYVFEFYDILIQALNSKLRFVSSFGKVHVVEKVKNEIKLVATKWLALNQSQSIYQTIMNKISLHSEHHFYTKELDEAILELKENYNNTLSSLIKYYLLSLEIEQTQILRKYVQSSKLLLELKSTIKSNESVYTDNRYGTILINISNNYLLLRDYHRSIKYAEESREYFNGIQFTQKIIDELVFHSYFYQNNFSECYKFIVFHDPLPINESTEVIYSKFNYYHACLEFANGNYLECIQLLKDYKEIEKDKEGWNIGKKILIILSRIELVQIDSLDLSIDSINKYFKRLSKTNYLNPRFAIILKICMIIVRENVDWKRIEKKKSRIMKYLKCFENNEMKWQIKSPELINFEDWILSKISVSSR